MRLLLGDLDGQVRGDRIGDLGIVVDLADRADHLGRDLLVELHVVLELGHHRARQRLGLDRVADHLGQPVGMRLVVGFIVGEAADLGPPGAFDQHLDGAVGQLQELQHRSQRADVEQRLRLGLVLAGVLLGDEQDLLLRAHHLFKRMDGFLAADEKRRDHMRKHDNIAQRQHREKVAVACGKSDGTRPFGCHAYLISFSDGRSGEAEPGVKRRVPAARNHVRASCRQLTNRWRCVPRVSRRPAWGRFAAGFSRLAGGCCLSAAMAKRAQAVEPTSSRRSE